MPSYRYTDLESNLFSLEYTDSLKLAEKGGVLYRTANKKVRYRARARWRPDFIYRGDAALAKILRRRAN